MIVMELDIHQHLTSTLFNPSPHRFSDVENPVEERMCPVVYTCNKCNNKVSFKTSDFEKHNYKSKEYSNLDIEALKMFEEELKRLEYDTYSFIDFYCPKCKQATIIVYQGRSSGYWGTYEFKIDKVLVLC